MCFYMNHSFQKRKCATILVCFYRSKKQRGGTVKVNRHRGAKFIPYSNDCHSYSAELLGRSEASTPVRSKHNSEDLPRTFCYVKALIQK